MRYLSVLFTVGLLACESSAAANDPYQDLLNDFRVGTAQREAERPKFQDFYVKDIPGSERDTSFFGAKLAEKKMKKICSDPNFAAAFTRDAFGFYQSAASVSHYKINAQTYVTENEWAHHMMESSTTEWTFLGWEQGRCHMQAKITVLDPQVAPYYGIMEGDMYINIEKRDNGYWKYVGASDSLGIDGGNNSFRSYGGAKSIEILNAYQATEKNRVALLQRQEEEQRQAEFEEWKRTHPREWATEQERLRVARERRRNEQRAAEEAERRKAEACEANGGTWGWQVRNGVTIGAAPACYFQTVH